MVMLYLGQTEDSLYTNKYSIKYIIGNTNNVLNAVYCNILKHTIVDKIEDNITNMCKIPFISFPLYIVHTLLRTALDLSLFCK